MSARRPRRIVLAVAAFAVLAPLAVTSGQRLQRSVNQGHALDASLQVGSGGYNRRVNRGHGGMNSPRYTFGATRSPYVVNSRGEMVYSPNNAFNPNSRFTVTGYSGDYTGRRAQRSFRYGR